MRELSEFNTDFLFTTPNYLTGAANAFNLAGDFYDYNSSETDQEADYKALKNDFNMVANELMSAVQKIMLEK